MEDYSSGFAQLIEHSDEVLDFFIEKMSFVLLILFNPSTVSLKHENMYSYY